MTKIHNMVSLGIGLLFLIVLQHFSLPRPIFRFLFPALLAFAVIVTAYNRWYLRAINKYNFWALVRPILLMFSAFGIFLIIPSESVRGLFLLSAVVVVAVVEAFIGNFSESYLINETLITAFGLFLAITGISLYVSPFYKSYINFFYISGIFFAAVLCARGFYEYSAQSREAKWLGSLILGLFSAELFWVLNFLPFHFSVTAFLLLDFFYFCLILNYYFFYNILSLKKIQFHLVLAVATALLVFLATPWKIIS